MWDKRFRVAALVAGSCLSLLTGCVRNTVASHYDDGESRQATPRVVFG